MLLLPISYANRKGGLVRFLNPAPCLSLGSADSQQNAKPFQPTLDLSVKVSFACRTQETQAGQ